MRRLLALAAATVIAGCGGALAQTGPMPGMGATSPLGSMNFNAPAGPVGIPLGTTELDTGGTSPLPGMTPCAAGGMSGLASSGSTGAFDGGGSTLGSGMGTSCVTSGTAASAGTASTPAAGLQAPAGANVNTIPLGATELTNPGVSPMVGVPTPGLTTSSCGSASAMDGTMGSAGTTGC